MKKIIEISKCQECKYSKKYNTWYLQEIRCRKKTQKRKNSDEKEWRKTFMTKIPDWCPLPDSNGG